MGVPYAEAWGMPVDMALDMLGLSSNTTKSKQLANNPAPETPPSTSTAASSSATPRKLVAARRKSKTTI